MAYVYSLYDTINIRNGLVGIGTTIPQETFHVDGSLYVERLTNAASNIDFAFSGLSNIHSMSLDVITSDNSVIGFGNKSLSNISSAHVTNDITVDGTVFASNLHVTGSFTTLDTLTSNTEQMTVTNSGTGPALIVRQTGAESVASFYDDNQIAMYIGGGTNDAGFVGIGTAVADSRLHIVDNTSTYAHVETSTSDAAQMKLSNNSGHTFVGPSSTGTIDLMSTSILPMRIGTNNAEAMHVAVNGFVGIGSQSPAYKMDIGGQTRIQDSLYLYTNNMNTIFYSYGGQTFVTGNCFIGLTMAWVNATLTNQMAFRVTVKCHIASDTNVAYRKFESIVSPTNDSANGYPKQVVSTEIVDTANDDFVALAHTITRNTDNAVDLRVSWTALNSCTGNIQVSVFAHSALGDFTFTPVST